MFVDKVSLRAAWVDVRHGYEGGLLILVDVSIKLYQLFLFCREYKKQHIEGVASLTL